MIKCIKWLSVDAPDRCVIRSLNVYIQLEKLRETK